MAVGEYDPTECDVAVGEYDPTECDVAGENTILQSAMWRYTTPQGAMWR